MFLGFGLVFDDLACELISSLFPYFMDKLCTLFEDSVTLSKVLEKMPSLEEGIKHIFQS